MLTAPDYQLLAACLRELAPTGRNGFEGLRQPPPTARDAHGYGWRAGAKVVRRRSVGAIAEPSAS
jgi:hypothetical protein